jgi:lipopolysaccharide export system protein LptA
LHSTAVKTLWNRKTDIVELWGNATVNQEGETIIADYIRLDKKDRVLEARGHVSYLTGDITLQSEEMVFDLKTKTGSITNGRMSNDAFSLTGDRINKLGKSRYQTQNGTYTTCKDCPQSWVISGEEVDLTLGGYAFIKGAQVRVLDTPIAWAPYLVLPMKSERQTGLLFPQWGVWNNSFFVMQPFFWAISSWADARFTAGYYVDRGPRARINGRYSLTPRSNGSLNLFYFNDSVFVQRPHRLAGGLSAIQELPWGFDAKINLYELTDHYQPNTLGDLPGGSQPVLPSTFSISGASNYLSGYIEAARYRNLLYFRDPTLADNATVQVFPRAELTTKDRFLFGWPIAVGLSGGVTRFTRLMGTYDLGPDLTLEPIKNLRPMEIPAPYSRDPIPGMDPIRRALRFHLNPNIYTTFRPWDLFAVVPSLEYRGYFYNFEGDVPNLLRGYLVFRSDFATQLERVYDTGNPLAPKIKHLIRPNITYSLIPYFHESRLPGGHPFLNQMEYARRFGVTGYNFDNHDIVPIDSNNQNFNNNLLPIGNAISYGITTQLIRREGEVNSTSASYSRFAELYARQAVNFRELFKAEDQRPFSILDVGGSFSYRQFTLASNVSYIPHIVINERQLPWTFGASLSYVLESATRQRIMSFQRNFNLSYRFRRLINSNENAVTFSSVFSITDSIMPSASIAYDFYLNTLQSVSGGVLFQSPSQCWRLGITIVHALCGAGQQQLYCTNPQFDFSMNFSGSGYSGIGEFASSVVGGGG